PMECILRAHRVQAFRSGAASFRFAPFRSASAAYLPTHIQSLAGLRRLTVPLPNTTVIAASIMFIPKDFPLSHFDTPLLLTSPDDNFFGPSMQNNG
ncbi:MAG: hypothetical protein Q4B68_09375, partial [Bacteroidales bacterium]|nr:hypothetical protein [Bacteroidales bacterium]